jgi:hypothetical protein
MHLGHARGCSTTFSHPGDAQVALAMVVPKIFVRLAVVTTTPPQKGESLDSKNEETKFTAKI